MWFRRAKKMRVVTLDESGKELGDEQWVDVSKPASFRSDGIVRVGSYVARALQSSARFTSLIVATPDHRMAVTLRRRDGIPELGLIVEWRSEPERERAIRQFFAERGLSAARDYLGGNGGVPDAIRLLDYCLPPDVHFITALTKDVLRQIYHLQEQDALDFTYQEHHDAV
jgi:hypothetical protein